MKLTSEDVREMIMDIIHEAMATRHFSPTMVRRRDQIVGLVQSYESRSLSQGPEEQDAGQASVRKEVFRRMKHTPYNIDGRSRP